MTENQAERLTKYFAEGVMAYIWCHAGHGQWSLTISRQAEQATFYTLAGLQFSILDLWKSTEQKRKPLELYSETISVTSDPVIFHSFEEAVKCVEQITMAIAYIQQMSDESRWKEIPADVFSRWQIEVLHQ